MCLCKGSDHFCGVSPLCTVFNLHIVGGVYIRCQPSDGKVVASGAVGKLGFPIETIDLTTDWGICSVFTRLCR